MYSYNMEPTHSTHGSADTVNPAGNSACVLGATGAVGGNIVRTLLASPFWPRIATLGRRKAPEWESTPGRPVQHVTDVFDPGAYGFNLAGYTHAFCAFGVGQPSKEPPGEFDRVDIDAVLAFARACRKNDVRHFTHMTTVGADPASRIRYLRRKGELEAEINSLGFERTSHFRPSMLMTPTNRYGLSQAFMLQAMPVFDRFLHGAWRRYRSIDVADLGRAMVRNAERKSKGAEVFEWDGIRALLAT